MVILISLLPSLTNDWFLQLVACTLNAVCMALMDTGISMNYPTAAVKTALMPDDVIVFDPTSEQEEVLMKCLLIVCLLYLSIELVTTASLDVGRRCILSILKKKCKRPLRRSCPSCVWPEVLHRDRLVLCRHPPGRLYSW